ncbi:MFS transporter [Amycolatopsis sp.]|uniref:MFS transporter n=1 Tax=Amycolatopsis sp. TaxID=37632 RepID=UPI002DF8A14F|nr:MFS transporter [Amycolatopsis sp.]
MTRSQQALLVALGVDSFGSGLFLPLALVYVTQVVGLPLGLAGTVITAGTMASLLVPPFAGRLVDRVGPCAVVISAQFVQAVGAFSFLVADGVTSVLAASILLSTGQQLFYCALYVLIADVSGDGPKERPFTVTAMVRTALFGLGALAAGALYALAGSAGYRIAVAVDGVSFLCAALLLAKLVRAPHPAMPVREAPVQVWRDRPYLALIAIAGLFGLSLDFFLVGMPVYVLDQLNGPGWLPGVILALLTAVISVGGTLALRATRGLSRVQAMGLGSVLYVVWCALSLCAVFVSLAWLAVYLLVTTLVLAVATLVFGPRANVLAEAVAPPAARGRYLAAFQYAFTCAQVLAPAVVGLFSLAVWVPWALVAASACLAVLGLRWVTPRLPPRALGAVQS